MNKFSFVKQLLENEKFNSSQKERFFKLVSKELETAKHIDNQVLEDIQLIKKKLGISNGNTSKERHVSDLSISETDISTIIKPQLENDNKKKHSPKTMVKFLYSFSIDEKFKWFTHNPEGLITDFDYKTYIYNAKNAYNKTTGWHINNSTYHNVKNFIINTGEDKKTKIFGRGNVIFSWRDLEKWCRDHPEVHPYSAELNGDLFKKYINQFKHTIEFRIDDSDLTFSIRLRKHIRKCLGVDFKPIFSDSFNEIGQSVKIFCDVYLLFNAIKQIVEWIVLNKAKSNEIEINLINLDEFYQLEIIHKNSYMSLSPNNSKLNGLDGDLDKTRKMLFSVADWEILATLESNGKKVDYKIVCLDSDTELKNNVLTPNKLIKSNNKIKGVKNILKLYKTQDL